MPATAEHRLPLWLKVAYTAFLAVMIPVYWVNYGPTNFLYFCDVALFLVLIALWTEHALPASMAAVGILLPQLLWCLDFLTELFGLHFLSMTSYMFDERNSLFLRGLSFFHGWLPFLIVFIVRRLGYDRRGLLGWTILGWSLCLIAYFCFPPAGAILENSKIPRNINYVFGFSDETPQSMMPAPAYLVTWMMVLLLIVYIPTHFVLRKWMRPAPQL